MTIPSVAAGAYASVARLGDSAAGLGKVGAAAGVAGEAGDATSFGAMLKDALGQVTDSGHRSDAQTRAMVAGKADMVDVVTAVSENEVAEFSSAVAANKIND